MTFTSCSYVIKKLILFYLCFKIWETFKTCTYRGFIRGIGHRLLVSEWLWPTWSTCGGFLWKMVPGARNRLREGKLKVKNCEKLKAKDLVKLLKVCCMNLIVTNSFFSRFFVGFVILDSIAWSVGERWLRYCILPHVNSHEQLPLAELAQGGLQHFTLQVMFINFIILCSKSINSNCF